MVLCLTRGTRSGQNFVSIIISIGSSQRLPNKWQNTIRKKENKCKYTSKRRFATKSYEVLPRPLLTAQTSRKKGLYISNVNFCAVLYRFQHLCEPIRTPTTRRVRKVWSNCQLTIKMQNRIVRLEGTTTYYACPVYG